ncbi:hypothetical protein [Paludibacterium purpuratum]|uniref:Uncharacterized protein n=1 Tax=Paludibacterium purpuratum TaxID=1144873 RepID=A0A4V3DV65_9NEIS|nr:hypothetical protein [Paludibacterium purpuratum]TDR79729.1 hypothetical protein DFP86_10793 [Paludibacterium purpuratum]
MADTYQTFGGGGGNFSTPINMAGAQVTFYWGDALVAIMINNTKYGGNTGSLQSVTVQMPTDGKVVLKKMQAKNDQGYMVVSYLEFEILGASTKVGKLSTNAATLTTDCVIMFTGINCGGLIDQLKYQIIPS